MRDAAPPAQPWGWPADFGWLTYFYGELHDATRFGGPWGHPGCVPGPGCQHHRPWGCQLGVLPENGRPISGDPGRPDGPEIRRGLLGQFKWPRALLQAHMV